MRDLFGPSSVTGYCTNVHAGDHYALMRSNLERHALPVKEGASPDEPMGIGLWLSARTVREMAEQHEIETFAAWLDRCGLIPFTLNGFPYGNFHQKVVKHRVYEPRWDQPARLEYTIALADILMRLLGDQPEGSISTLPIGWRADIAAVPDRAAAAARNLLAMAEYLHRLEQQSGKLIHLDIEPEPGCHLATSTDVVEFFRCYLLGNDRDHLVRRHLRICHDICHAAVMFEPQAQAMEHYARSGIKVGKVHVSSAVRADFGAMSDDPTRQRAHRQLHSFKETRYLHQSVIRRPGVQDTFYEDLPKALEQSPTGEWRIHFHVPLFLDRFGDLQSTQDQVIECLGCTEALSECRHYEVETYAWQVLPADLKCVDLSEGIVRELAWLRRHAWSSHR